VQKKAAVCQDIFKIFLKIFGDGNVTGKAQGLFACGPP
jgi:hypothetical protein